MKFSLLIQTSFTGICGLAYQTNIILAALKCSWPLFFHNFCWILAHLHYSLFSFLEAVHNQGEKSAMSSFPSRKYTYKCHWWLGDHHVAALHRINAVSVDSIAWEWIWNMLYRLCTVCPENRKLLGIHWPGNFYIDHRLPFSLPSSPSSSIA